MDDEIISTAEDLARRLLNLIYELPHQPGLTDEGDEVFLIVAANYARNYAHHVST